MHFLLEEIGGEKHFIQAMPWGGLNIIGTKTDLKPIPPVWQSRIGKYTVSNSSKEDAATVEEAEIAIENGFVVLKYGFNPEISFGQNATIALELKNVREAFVLGYGRGGGESVQFDESGRSFQFMGLVFSR